MKVIWKYEIDLDGLVRMPLGAKVLTVQTQNDLPHIWVEVDNEQSRYEMRRFEQVATGGFVPTRATYIGTFQLERSQLVFHLYDLGRK